jgi:hypothetical protein
VTSTPGTSSGRRKVIRLENSSPEENTEYPPLPDKKTWDDILKDVQKPEVPEELDTPPSQRREPAKESTPGSGQRLNFNNVNPDPAPAKETFVLKISEADAEAEVDAEPENEEEGEKTETEIEEEDDRGTGMCIPDSATPKASKGPSGTSTKRQQSKEKRKRLEKKGSPDWKKFRKNK